MAIRLRRHHEVYTSAVIQSPPIQLSDDAFHRFRYGGETPLPTAVNGVDALRDHIVMPVGTLGTGRSFRSPDGYDLVRMFHW